MIRHYRTIRFFPANRALVFDNTLAQYAALTLPGASTSLGDCLTWEIEFRLKLTTLVNSVEGACYFFQRGVYDEFAAVGFNGSSSVYYWSNIDNGTGALVQLLWGDWGVNAWHVGRAVFSRDSLDATTGTLQLYRDGELMQTATIPTPKAGPGRPLSLGRVNQDGFQGFYANCAYDWFSVTKDGEQVINVAFDEDEGPATNAGTTGGQFDIFYNPARVFVV